MNPYLVLGVPMNADDARIRQAYLAAVKQASPDTDPARFKEIAAAYALIKDEASRLRHELFDTTCPGHSPWDTLLRNARQSARPAPLPFEAMKDLLRNCSKT